MPLFRFTIAIFLAFFGVATADIYVAPDGDDAATGTQDAPLATLTATRDAVRALKRAGDIPADGITVWLRGGVYRISEPIIFTPEDSGTEQSPITYAAYPGERPIISGGRAIHGLTKHPDGIWRATIPEARERRWLFRQLFVNGARRTLARSPNEGYYLVGDKLDPVIDPMTGEEMPYYLCHYFHFRPGDLKAWKNPTDTNLVVYQLWETAIVPLKAVDETTNTAETTGHCRWSFYFKWLGNPTRYVVQNHPGALDAPGEWQLDRDGGVLSLVPFGGEDLSDAEVVAPVAAQLLILQGDPKNGQYVEHLRFRGLSFQHTRWTLPLEGYGSPQAAALVNAAFDAIGARHCTIERSEIAHTANHAIWLRSGSRDNRIAQSELHDLGAGGAYIGEMTMPASDAVAVGHNEVYNCFIHDIGNVYAGAQGVWIGQSSDNLVAHNEVSDTRQSGVCVGWSWGYEPTACHRNRIEYNHVHHIGSRVLSDLGGIYTLGISTGTVIRNNLIHDCLSYYDDAGAGIYPDEGSSGILIENNVVYRTTGPGLSIHYGQDLTIRNNVFAQGYSTAAIGRGRNEKPRGVWFTFHNNVVRFPRGRPFVRTGVIRTADHNVYHHEGGRPVLFPGLFSLREWQEDGLDAHSVVADPLFVDPDNDDFRLRAQSPALKLGFKPIDTTECGLVGPDEWRTRPSLIERPMPEPVSRAEPSSSLPSIDDDFESTVVGEMPKNAWAYGVTKTATISITDEAAAAGRHSVKIQDSPEPEHPYNPALIYDPAVERGHVSLSFGLRHGAGALITVEWRDSGNPYHTGPSLAIDAEGKLAVGGKTIAELPIGKWSHFQISGTVGRGATGLWDLTVEIPGQEKIQLTKLPCSADIGGLSWLAFISNATTHTVFYVDNVKLRVTMP